MNLFARREPIFGLDIGHETLKVAVGSPHGGSAQIVSLAEVPVPKGSKTARGIKDKDIIAQKIREAKETAKPKRITAKACISALPESLVFTKVVDLPTMSDRELAKALPFELSNIFPISPEEAYFDWAMLGPAPKQGEMEVLVVAAPKTLVEDFIDVVDKSGSELVALETKPVALTRLFAKPTMKGGFIIADIGAVVTGIDLVVDGNLHLTATVEVGGDHLKTNPEAVKQIADEIRNLAKYYVNRIGAKTEFRHVALCGGGANLKGVGDSLEKLLKIPVAVGQPALAIPQYNPTFATVLGLALRGDR